MKSPDSGQDTAEAFNGAASDPADEQKISSLADKLRKAVLGQDAAVAAVMKSLARKKTPSVFLMGPPGVGKTEMAKRLAEEMFGQTPNNSVSGMIILDEPLNMTYEITEELGRRSGRRLGEIAAQACHDGLSETIIPMKPIQLKRGFSYIM